MLVFIKKGEYDRRIFIENCFNRYQKFVEQNGVKNLVVAKGKNSKPYFKDFPDIRFSISHSGDIVVLAMGKTEIGIDIEKIRDLDYKSISERYFYKGEIEACKSLEDYFAVWTAKEAYLKLTADGLGGLGKYDITAPLTFEGKEILITPIEFLEGYKGAIAAEKQEIVFVDYID